MNANSHSHDMHLPLGPLLGAATLLLGTLLAVLGLRWSGVSIDSRSQAPVVAQRALHFIDQPDGGITVRDGDVVLAQVPAGQHGFLRGTLRALVRERRLAKVGESPPFLLLAHADGRLTLRDDQTGQRVDLESFGPANSQVFAHLLAGKPLPDRPMAR